MGDLRDWILRNVAGKRVTASIIADDAGIIVGTTVAKEEAERLGLSVESIITEGSQIRKGDEIARLCGSPKQIVMAEETLIGLVAKPSGIATSAHKFVEATGGRPKVVCGAWKKMPWVLKDTIRQAVIAGGALDHLSPNPFIYLDKNYIKILGGIKESLGAVADLKGYLKVIQVKGMYKDIILETCEAAQSGANIIFIDTGIPSDVNMAVERLVQLGLRKKISIAFGGGITLESIDELKAMDIDILDIGRQIVDAPLLDMRMEILNTNGK